MLKRKVIICDDEVDARILLNQYLEDFKDLEVIAECRNGLEAISAINTLEPDLVFLDIQMPSANGFQVLQKIVHIPQVIFSTAHDNYALKAFESNAIDYLLKPYTKERFNLAVNKVLLNTNWNLENIKSLSDKLQLSQALYPEKVFVQKGNKLISLSTNDIVYFEAEGDYTRLCTKDNKSYLSNYGISALEQKLNPVIFSRIHRSSIINVNYIREVIRDAGGYQVIMQNNDIHRISKTYLHVIKNIVI
ncbi:LytTR family DNA-binding domain-containing protein [Chitinophaga sp. HK235]|uniref:LytR/AlgR family response regulator transcription factor n=1 Tax=Chitinophaga sp. HK235 TaxID=2952571 RepID=UPI001BAB5ADC|nr:LytTR family DNA-binding domain-containing protein [Chitinophaga sp. HK235]